jgi:hypothetical protein
MISYLPKIHLENSDNLFLHWHKKKAEIVIFLHFFLVECIGKFKLFRTQATVLRDFHFRVIFVIATID